MKEICKDVGDTCTYKLRPLWSRSVKEDYQGADTIDAFNKALSKVDIWFVSSRSHPQKHVCGQLGKRYSPYNKSRPFKQGYKFSRNTARFTKKRTARAKTEKLATGPLLVGSYNPYLSALHVSCHTTRPGLYYIIIVRVC